MCRLRIRAAFDRLLRRSGSAEALHARLSSLSTRASDGRVVNEEVQQIGTASACAQITSLVPGANVDFAVRFDLPAGSFGGNGACRVASNGVPVENVVLAGCSIRLTDVPKGFVAGVAGSASVLTTRAVPGVQTGSFWTLRVYKSQPLSHRSRPSAASGQ